MNILHVVNGFDISGRSRLIHELCLGLRGPEYGFTIVSLSGNCRYHQQDIECRNVDRSDGLDLLAVKRLRRYIKRRAAKIVHSHGRGALPYASLAARTVPGTKLIHTVHRADGDLVSKRRWVRRFVLHRVDAVSGVSDAARDAFCSANAYPLSRSSTIHNGIDLAHFQGAARRSDRCGETVIGTVANLSHDKDIDTLLRGFAELHRVLPGAVLVIVGDGPQTNHARSMALRLGIDRHVRFFGFRVDVPDLLAGFDVFVFSTRTEGFGLAVLEAMAARVPVVASCVGGVPEIVEHGVSGLLFEAGNATGMKEAVVRLLEDDKLRDSMVECAFNTVSQRFTLRHMCDQYASLYQEVAAR